MLRTNACVCATRAGPRGPKPGGHPPSENILSTTSAFSLHDSFDEANVSENMNKGFNTKDGVNANVGDDVTKSHTNERDDANIGQ